jgi:hypothetical protein
MCLHSSLLPLQETKKTNPSQSPSLLPFPLSLHNDVCLVPSLLLVPFSLLQKQHADHLFIPFDVVPNFVGRPKVALNDLAVEKE